MKYVILVLFLLISPAALSLGIATTYLENDTLKLYPGDSTIYDVNIQNADPFDVPVEFNLRSDVAKVVGNSSFTVPRKNYDTIVRLNVTIPQNDSPGKVYPVVFSVKPVVQNNGQMLLNIQLNEDFNVLVEGRPRPEFRLSPVYIAILLMAAGLVTVILLYKKSLQVSEKIIKNLPAVKLPQLMLKPNFPLVKTKRDNRIAPDGKYFYLSSGEAIISIGELLAKLQKMDENIFSHHVNQEKNDFANWIRDVFGETELSDKLLGKTKEEMIRLLQNESF